MEKRLIVELVYKTSIPSPNPALAAYFPGALERDSLGGRTAASLVEGRCLVNWAW